MALKRSMLTAMGIDPEKIDEIMQGHGETVDGFKADLDKAHEEAEELRKQAERVPALEKEIEDLKASQPEEDWKARYDELEQAKEALQGEFDAYKAGVAEKDANAEKLSLYKAVLREIGLDEKRVEKAAKLKDLSELTVEEGKLAGLEELKKSEAEEWAEFIPATSTQGQSVPNPPAKPGEAAAGEANPRAVEIARQRHERLYGKSEEQA